MNPTFSIIIPVYNVAPYLRECLDSVLAQTYTDWEAICVDDGSTDESGEILEEYAKRDSRFHVIHQENQGQASARNNGIDISTGEWITFLDSDDMIHPMMLESMLGVAEKNNVSICACQNIEENKLPADFLQKITPEYSLYDVTEEYLLKLINNSNKIYWVVWGKIYKRDLIVRHPFTPGRIYEDNAVAPKVLYVAGRIAYTETPFYFYRINPESTTHVKLNIKKIDCLWAFEEQVKFFLALGMYNILCEICHRTIILYVILYQEFLSNEMPYENLEIIYRDYKRFKTTYSKYIHLSLNERKRTFFTFHPKMKRLRNWLKKFVGINRH